ncbi:hypothetical protein [Bacillus cereus]|uniref:hypothetical protein n=2 Tax=Bacillaceae TaxID=186817 RepID=UPI001F3877B3|nr:hypothetical protein [Bacillus cereus]
MKGVEREIVLMFDRKLPFTKKMHDHGQALNDMLSTKNNNEQNASKVELSHRQYVNDDCDMEW